MKKINGISRPLHPFQICTYIFFSGCVIVYFLITFQLSSNAERIVGAILEVLFGICVFVSGYICTATDTTDSLLQEQKQMKKEGKDYSHIVSEYHCGHDRAYVKENSKHCRRCGRCTEGFDHHCKWINNDIGRKNYKSFVAMITSVALFLITFIIFGAIVTARYVRQNDFASYDTWIFPNSKGNILGGLIILWIFMAISALFFLLDLNLVLFHIFLIRKGLTTFQYITLVEERKEYKKEMEFAMKALGHKRKTRLDFILCLKPKKKLHRGQTANAPVSGETKDEGKDKVRKDDKIPIGNIERDLIHGHEEEMAGKKTAIDFFSKENFVTEANDLLSKSPGSTPKVMSLKGLTTKLDDSPNSPQKGKKVLTEDHARKSSKINFMVINLDNQTDAKEIVNQPVTGESPIKVEDFEEMQNQEHINNIKNEKYEVDHDHHLHKEEEEPINMKSPEAKMMMKIPLEVHVSTPVNNDHIRKGRPDPLESRHNNYVDTVDSDGKPNFFIKNKLDLGNVKDRIDSNNEAISKFEAVVHQDGSNLNTYKEVGDFVPEPNYEEDDQVVEDNQYNRTSTLEEQTASKRIRKKRTTKELEIEVIS